jgi:aldose 1-epimerase
MQIPGLPSTLLLVAGLVLAQAIAGAWSTQGGPSSIRPGFKREPFGKLADGTEVELLTLTNKNGVEVQLITFGAIVRSIKVPDRNGKVADIVHGFDDLDGYVRAHPYFGAVIGRYGNRIGNARFTLEGTTYKLAANNGPNHLHGGVKGFDKYVWDVRPSADNAGVTFSRTSPDGEEGYPGTLQVRVTYVLTDTNQLRITYEAATDKATPVNLTSHSYFNLAGHDAGDVMQHQLAIVADRYTPVDRDLIPTGELARVEGTPFDFRKPVAIGARINGSHEQLTFGRGYDHNWVLGTGAGLRRAARVVEPASGRTLDVSTTEPGLQFYTGNFLDGTIKGKGGTVYKHRSAFCLETQHFPDSPNKPDFPSTILRPGETYRSQTVFSFGVDR